MNKGSGRKSKMKKEGRKKYKWLRNELESATEKGMKEYIDSMCDKIIRCQKYRTKIYCT